MATRETLAVTDTATGLTLATVRANGEDTALITVETAEIRFTVDGTTATSSIGHVVGSGGTIKLETST